MVVGLGVSNINKQIFMKLKIILSGSLFAIANFLFAQTHPLIVSGNIKLPQDTLVKNRILKSLNGFLSLKDSANKNNLFVLKEDLLETSVLLDEMKEIEKSVRFKDNNFYKGYLTNLVRLDSTTYSIEFAYIGVNGNTPIYVASFKILGKQKADQFYFSSPLKQSTHTWKSKKLNNCTFYFKNTLDEKSAATYAKSVAFMDNKLKSITPTDIYFCDGYQEVLQNIGVVYKLDYNGINSGTLYARENNKFLSINGSVSNTFDPHDVWHDRLHNVLPISIINKPVDEGCAYLYGGSWGISWAQILKTFKEKVSSNKKSDWLNLYDEFYNFGETQQNHLIVTYVINALIVEKIEKEKGISAVIELLSCGNYQKGNENYFKVLEKLTGINKANFNDSTWVLINNSK